MTVMINTVFKNLSDEQSAALLPIAKVAKALHIKRGSLLADDAFRESIRQADDEVASLLDAVYVTKSITWKGLSSWISQEEQNSHQIAMDTSTQFGLLAQGQGKIYKRTLKNDINTLLT